mmetsp:Transcript_3015/g.5719  ORF Transcript_3015/g.5719 Transcript_3015/m.5719 type:complete len:280 (+) Transcript_3015:727-1566(+)
MALSVWQLKALESFAGGGLGLELASGHGSLRGALPRVGVGPAVLEVGGVRRRALEGHVLRRRARLASLQGCLLGWVVRRVRGGPFKRAGLPLPVRLREGLGVGRLLHKVPPVRRLREQRPGRRNLRRGTAGSQRGGVAAEVVGVECGAGAAASVFGGRARAVVGLLQRVLGVVCKVGGPILEGQLALRQLAVLVENVRRTTVDLEIRPGRPHDFEQLADPRARTGIPRGNQTGLKGCAGIIKIVLSLRTHDYEVCKQSRVARSSASPARKARRYPMRSD